MIEKLTILKDYLLILLCVFFICNMALRMLDFYLDRKMSRLNKVQKKLRGEKHGEGVFETKRPEVKRD